MEEHLLVLGVLEATLLLPWGGGQLSRHLLVPMAVSYLRTVMNRSTWATEDSGLCKEPSQVTELDGRAGINSRMKEAACLLTVMGGL